MPSGAYGRGGANFVKEPKAGGSPTSPTASARSVSFKLSEKVPSGGYGRGGGNYMKRTKPVAIPVASDKSSSLKSIERKPSGAYGRGGGNYVKRPKAVTSPSASDLSSNFKYNEKVSPLKRIALAMAGSRFRKSRMSASQSTGDTPTDFTSQSQNQDYSSLNDTSSFVHTLPEIIPAADSSYSFVVES